MSSISLRHPTTDVVLPRHEKLPCLGALGGCARRRGRRRRRRSARHGAEDGPDRSDSVPRAVEPATHSTSSAEQISHTRDCCLLLPRRPSLRSRWRTPSAVAAEGGGRAAGGRRRRTSNRHRREEATHHLRRGKSEWRDGLPRPDGDGDLEQRLGRWRRSIRSLMSLSGDDWDDSNAQFARSGRRQCSPPLIPTVAEVGPQLRPRPLWRRGVAAAAARRGGAGSRGEGHEDGGQEVAWGSFGGGMGPTAVSGCVTGKRNR